MKREQRESARCLPRDDDSCGWIATAPASPPPVPLSGDLAAETLVIGAGFTGLAAARRAAELRPGREVILLDAQRAGHGASARSSGFVVDLAHFVARMPAGPRERYIELARRGIADLRSVVRASSVDTQWDERGWFHVAQSESAAVALGMLRGWLDERGERYQWLEREALTEVIGTPFYRAGIRLPGSVLVHPGALVQALVRALPAEVLLCERSPVVALEPCRGGVRAVTPQGSVRAERVLMALNGYSAALAAPARRVLPLLTFGSLTRPLTAAEQEALPGEREWGLLAEDPMGSTVRRTRDQRLLIRNTVHYDRSYRASPAVAAEARRAHRRALAVRFPALADVDFQHSWSGVMGVTPSRTPFFGQLSAHTFSACGFTGAGIAMGVSLGARLAELALGEAGELLEMALAQPLPNLLPPEPFLSLGARWKAQRMNRLAGPGI